MVGIHAKIRNQWVEVLEIPQEDIGRLSHKPLKWLRFVAFATLGARGGLHRDGLGNNPVTEVEYETVLQADNLAAHYYFVTEGTETCQFADPEALDHDRRSISAHSLRLPSFPESVAARDGNLCVVTGSEEYQAAHIIPRSKGSLYIQSAIVGGRRHLYEEQLQLEHGIDSVQNGLILRYDLHDRFGGGLSGFLKTPNFYLDVGDIPRVESDEDIPASRVTFQHFKPYDHSNRSPVPQWDIRVDCHWQWSTDNNSDAPGVLLLDYHYGVAALQNWGIARAKDLLKSIHKKEGKKRQNPQKKMSSGSTLPARSTRKRKGREDVKTPYSSKLRPRPIKPRGRMESKDSRTGMSMDSAFELAALLGGYETGMGMDLDSDTEQQEREEEKHLQQMGREKVQEWLRIK